ncbi:AAA family ATPase [Actinomadura harenae]|uniref:ATP-binding protein n=1 Tax=Actinomadura harenae TaxID=2483351 RepID=A0A3M2LXN2_9ACTN|nr:ATP-binding protein [Actinomadura harenae]RMI42201.1 ATP-binding protein [Actinomadura harenae]
MRLLRFRAANHKSIRDEQTLSFVAVPKRGEPKPRATEIPPTTQVTGIYGANASGKSNVLDALHYMISCIRTSQTRWSPTGGVPLRPFKPVTGEPSLYELDFVLRGIRYTYGFEVDTETVCSEWLFSFPHGKARRLFERTGPEDYEFGRALSGPTNQIARLTRPNALYLSSAASNSHPLLSTLYEAFTKSIQVARQRDRNARLQVTTKILKLEHMPQLLARLLKVADLGIESVHVEETEISANIQRAMARFGEELDEFKLAPPPTHVDEIFLAHSSAPAVRFGLDEESDGTVEWLALIGYLLTSMGAPSVLMVDEVDASLHPHLTSTVIRMFKDPEINRHGSQLLFASHDTTLLGTLLDDKILDRDEVWFTEKDEDGATTLYALAEFKPRKDENVERGYLQGRYGAVPYLSYAEIRRIFQELHVESDEPRTHPPVPHPQDEHQDDEEPAAHRL